MHNGALSVQSNRSNNAKLINGEMKASSSDAVALKLQQIGYLPIQIRETSQNKLSHIGFFHHKLTRADILFFTDKLAITLKAGLPLDESLTLLAQSSESKALIELIESVISDTQDGMALSDSLEEHSSAFDRFYINTLRAGELAGSIHQVLSELANYLDHQHKLRNKLISAMIYPTVLFCVTVSTLLILLLYVVPQFQNVFSQMGQALPFSTQLVISMSNFVAQDGWMVIFMGGLLILLVNFMLRDETRRRYIDKLILKFPIVAETIIHIEVAKFSRTLSTLLFNGVSTLIALDVVAESFKNTVVRHKLTSVRESVKNGIKLSSAVNQQSFFPPMMIHLIHVGEETGQLGEMLHEVSEIYETELKEKIDRLMVIIEPVIIITLGVLVAFIIISVM